MKLLLASAAIVVASASMANAVNILLVTNNNTTTQSLNDFLTATEGHTVTRDARTNGPLATDATTFDLVILARETNSGDYDDGTEPADWGTLATPIVTMAPHIARSNRLGFVSTTALPLTGLITDYDAYPDSSHPLLSGVTSTTFLNTGTAMNTLSGALPTGSTVVATAGGNSAIWVTPAGSTLFNPGGAVAAGDVRIGFLRGPEGSWDNISGDGEQILRNVIAFATVPEPSSALLGVIGIGIGALRRKRA